MTLPRRERVRAATIEEIKEIACQHMAEKGAAALSLRAIAREMGMTSPALYRYFASRDALVTALIVDAYNALADALEAACDVCTEDDHNGRFAAIAYAYRDWALASPQEYALIFGTPIPAYEAPPDITGPVAARSMAVFLNCLIAAEQSGQADLSEAHNAFSPALQAQLQPWVDKFDFQGDPALLYLVMSNWGMIHGLVSLEIFGHLDPNMAKETSGALYRTEVEALAKRLKLK
ncbi:Transcriptional regulator, AcrR family [hydrothermal vent metagenome]|uniref:Transcriptional regulator, AcrR family n=1 Tax=hydrothermal vent metagenome TaxID=652676 RepID=A0A3B0USR4_9ZZZZ